MQSRIMHTLIIFFIFYLNIAYASDLYIKAGKLLDVEKGIILKNQIIHVHDERIKAISQDIQVPKSANVIDLSNQTVLPGLIDCHTHLVGDPHDADPVSELKKTAAQRAFESIPNAKATLLAGFTTVRDLGTYRALVDVALRDAINKSDVIGPRMYVSGGYVTITNGGGAVTGVSPDIALPWDLRFGIADSPEQVRMVVRRYYGNNVDVIKVIATGAFLAHGSDPGREDFSYEEIKAAVDEANAKGLKVAAHAHGALGIKNAILAGVSSIEHGTMLNDEDIELMKKHGTFLVADIYDDECITATTNNKEPIDFQEKEKNYGLVQRMNFAKAVKVGVNIAFGTDASVCPHGTNARQFAYQVQYGQTPLQAIQSATINAAKLIGVDRDLGSLSINKYADIVAVKGNPLKDIHVLENVNFVMKAGKVYKS